MRSILFVLGAAAALLSIACQKTVLHSVVQEQAPRAPVAAPAEPQYLRHTVKWPGETLSHIAQWYTGKVQHWETIAAHNRTIDLNTLRKGEIVLIPESILITRNAMPADIVQPPAKNPKPKPKIVKTAPKPRPIAPPDITEQFNLLDPVEVVSAPRPTPPNAESPGGEEIELFQPIP
jgi:hypothetical protein